MLRKLLNSLSRHSDQWVSEWNQTSTVRRRLRYSSIDRLLRLAGEHVGWFLLGVAVVTVAVTVIAWMTLPSASGQLNVDLVGSGSNLLVYFGNLWMVQATVAALVYPIVISFVAVLLRKRATATLGLRIYTLDAAVLPAGSAAISLVGWMGLQYLLLPLLPNKWIAAAVVGDSAWFILNALLTSRFLFRTIRFLNDDERSEIFKRFAVHVALPRELRANLMGLIFQKAQEQKLLPGFSYTSEHAGPKVLLYPMSTGSACVSIKINRDRIVEDIRLRPLGWAISLWLRRARRAKPAQRVAGLRPEFPLLQVAIFPGQRVGGNVTICRVQGSVTPGAISAFLFRRSVVFGSPPNKDVSYSTSDILEDVATEALELIEQSRFEAASGALEILTELHSILISSGEFLGDAGAKDNAALLPHPYGFASRRIHELWLDSYREIAQLAIDVLPSSSKPFEHHCYIARRLLLTLGSVHLDILLHLLHIPSHLMFRLGSWWASRIEERGVIRHDHIVGAELPIPLGRVYDESLQTFLGYWEQLDLWETESEEQEAKSDWSTAVRRGRFAIAHLERTVEFLLNAVLRGDTTAALWFTDSLLKWWGSRRYRFGDFDPYDVESPSLNAACFSREWREVEEALSVSADNAGTNTSTVASTALFRYWMDIRMAAALILLQWLPADTSEDAVSLSVAIALLKGQSLKSGGHDENVGVDSRHLFIQLCRMQLVDERYTAMLDKIVRNAAELRRPRMVPGRVYGSTGADDLNSLLSSQTLLLTAVTHHRLRFPTVDTLTRHWSSDLHRSERAERFLRQLRAAFDESTHTARRWVAETIAREIARDTSLTVSEARIKRSLTRLADKIAAARNRTIRDAPISQEKIRQLAQEISVHVLSKGNQAFPFLFGPILRAEADSGTQGSLTFRGVPKIAYTQPPLDPTVDLRSLSFREHVATQIGIEVLRGYLQSSGTTPLRADSESNFFEDITTASKALRSQGLTPLLLIPQADAPECARAWRYLRASDPERRKFSVSPRRAEDEFGVTAFFQDVPAYHVHISTSCFIVPREAFSVLKYTPGMDGASVQATAAPRNDDTIDLKFSWAFGAARV